MDAARDREPHGGRIGRRPRVVSLVLVVLLLGAVALGVSASPAPPADAAGPTALVLYDTTGPYGFLGEQYAMMTANLVSHFGSYRALPVARYTAGMMGSYSAVIYIGSTYDEPLPNAFLDDVISRPTPVMWLNNNIWQLTNRQFASTGQYWANVRGWDWIAYDTSTIGRIDYKGRSLSRYSADQSGILETSVFDPATATVLATASRADGSSFPWALRSGNLTYIGEIPLSYISEDNRYLAFADLLFDALAPATPERHRALVRIEDVSAESDPAELRAVADVLAAEGVPFSVTVISEYRDPTGVYNDGRPDIRPLSKAPEVVSALKYMQSKGATLIMHGWTHQLDGLVNPYNQVSGDDFEFFTAHIDGANNVVYDGSVPGDSAKWAQGRIDKAKKEFKAAKLPVPTMFTPPHYAASAIDYGVFRKVFRARYDRGIYFSGQLAGGRVSTTQFVGQFFPYPVTDINGSRIVPENLGNEEPDEFNNHPPRWPADIIANAAANLVVRDGFASFFWHPYLVSDPRVGTAHLQQIVRGIKALGYTFVSADSIAGSPTPSALRQRSTHSPRGKHDPARAGSTAAGTVQVQAATSARPVPPEVLTANRRPARPAVTIGDQLRRVPDRGPAASVNT